jgi:hypothetical protein
VRSFAAPRGERLLSRLRRVLRTRHYSAHTEAAYVGWVRRFVRFHGPTHPSAMGEREVEAFDVEGGEILVRAGKGGKDRRMVLPDVAREPLRAHLAAVRRLVATPPPSGNRVASVV